MIGDFKNQIDIFPPMAYYNSNRTPHTSHASDVSHGETFFYVIGKFDFYRTPEKIARTKAGMANRRWLKKVNVETFFKFIVIKVIILNKEVMHIQ